MKHAEVTRRNTSIRAAGLAIIDVEEVITAFAESSIERQMREWASYRQSRFSGLGGARKLKNAALLDQAFCNTLRSSRMSFTFSIPITFSIRFVQFALPRTGSTKSRHFWTTSSRVMGLSTVPRTSV